MGLLPVEPDVGLRRGGAIGRHDHLVVGATHSVAVGEHPLAGADWLVMLELSLEIGAIGEQPLAMDQLALVPGSLEAHSRVIEHIGALAVLLASVPLPRVDILIGICVKSLALLLPGSPVPIVLALVSVPESADPVFVVVSEFALVLVPVRVGVFATAVSLAVFK